MESFLHRTHWRLGPRYPERATLLAVMLSEIVIVLAAAAQRLDEI